MDPLQVQDRVPRQAWIVVGLSFAALLAALGVRMSFGAFVTAWESGFGATRSEISLVSSVNLLVYGLGMPFAGRLADRLGTRRVLAASFVLLGVGLCAGAFAQSVWHLVALYGVLASTGICGASSVTVSVAIVKWFKEKRSLALGIASCGIPAGQMVIAPLSIYLVDKLGWRHTLLLYGLVYLFVLSAVFWIFYRDAPPGFQPAGPLGGDPPASAQGGSDRGLTAPSAATLGWWLPLLVVGPYFICGFTDLGLISTHLIPLAEGRGFSAAVIALTVTIDAGANLVGNVLTGYLADRVRVAAVLAVMYLVRAVGLTILFFAADPLTLFTFAILNGSVEASTIAPTAALCAKLYGIGRVGTVFGLVSACHQIGAATGAFLVGAIFAGTGGYAGGLLLSITLLVVASALTAAIRRRSRQGGMGPVPARGRGGFKADITQS